MHEMAYLKRIEQIVVAAGERNGIKEVQQINLVVGELRDFIDDLVQGYFSFLARGTIAENAKVVIEKVPFTVQCAKCGNIYPADIRSTEQFACPECGSHEYGGVTGRELYIKDIIAN